MRTLAQTELNALLFDEVGPPVAIILAPNYEARSALGPIELFRASPLPHRVKTLFWNLRTKHGGVAPLESLKHENTEAVLGLFKDRDIKHHVEHISYPDNFNPSSIVTLLSSIANGLGADGRIVIDISPMPRRLLAAIMRWRMLSIATCPAASRLVILYALAKSYVHHPSEEGEWRLLDTDQKLLDVLGTIGHERMHCLTICGRQGFDAAQLIDELQGNLDVDAYVLMSQYNLRHSLEVLRTNLHTLVARGITVRYCLGIDSGHERMMQWANTVPVDPGNAHVIAPFGPKPLALSAILAADQLRRRYEEAGIASQFLGVVALGAHRYNNVYSLGFAGWEFMELGP